MTSAVDEANALLMGGGGKSAFSKDSEIGTVVGGKITAINVAQQTDYVTGKPKTWDNGDPMKQIVVTVETDERDDANDDGARNFYLKGGAKRTNTTQGAVHEACRKAGVSGLAVGGTLSMAYIGTEPSTQGSDRKLWSAKYEPPTVSVADAAPADPLADPFAD